MRVPVHLTYTVAGGNIRRARPAEEPFSPLLP